MARKELINKAASHYAIERQEDLNYPVCNWEYEIENAYEAGVAWSDEHPDLYSVTRKAVERERKHLIKKAYKWLNENVEDHTRFYEDYDVHDVVASNYAIKKEFIEAFIKAIEGQQ